MRVKKKNSVLGRCSRERISLAGRTLCSLAALALLSVGGVVLIGASGPRVAAQSSTEPPVANSADGEPAPAGKDEGRAAEAGEAPAGEAGDAMFLELRERFLDRDSIRRDVDEFAAALFERARGESPARLGRARRLAAEAYEIAGRFKDARRVYGELARLGPLDEHRAFGLFALGQDRFEREFYFERRGKTGATLPGASTYWDLLVRNHPDSRWTQQIARPRRYLSLAAGGQPIPRFEAEFAIPGGAAETISSESLAGKVAFLHFWRAGNGVERDRGAEIDAAVRGTLESFPDLAGRLVYVGINVDADEALFREARSRWKTARPEHHAGSFSAPLVEAFALPRVPHWVVIGHDGIVRFIGADYPRFQEAGGLAMRRARGLDE